MASQLPDTLTVEEIFEMNLEDFKSIFTQKGMVVKGFNKCQLQIQLIILSTTVGREDKRKC